MATSNFRNKNNVRPVKRGHTKNQRVGQHRKRLMALGMPAEEIRHLSPKDMRILLLRPLRVAAKYAKADA